MIVLWTLGAEYAVGFVSFGLYAFFEYAPGRTNSTRVRWYETWWGRPVAAFVDGVGWPISLVRIVKDAL